MLPTYVLARDHLEQAVSILKGGDPRTRQLRYIIERTVALIGEFERRDRPGDDNIIDFVAFQQKRTGESGPLRFLD